MGIPIDNLPKFPIDPADSANQMQALADALRKTQRTVADNFSPKGRQYISPRPVVVQITGNKVTSVDGQGNNVSTTLGAGWYTGKMQIPPQPQATSTAAFDPSVALDLTKLYQAKGTTEDCYVFNARKTGMPTDGKTYVWGEFQGLSKTVSSTGTSSIGASIPTSLPTRPVVLCEETIIGSFLLTNKATRRGSYVGSSFAAPSSAIDFTIATMPTQSDLGVSLGDTVYLVNRTELGRDPSEPTQWDLMYSIGLGVAVIVTGTFRCMATDGTPVYMIDSINFENCST